jgi:hypothetical protein
VFTRIAEIFLGEREPCETQQEALSSTKRQHISPEKVEIAAIPTARIEHIDGYAHDDLSYVRKLSLDGVLVELLFCFSVHALSDAKEGFDLTRHERFFVALANSSELLRKG